ncbi:hypothetical protein N864_06415 [Intrasporangium chromatireducens Q5-1]|uniref:Uncharacterized protein n=1 Tax=Intrasporangium chromatireducens Q5-1 TaxID=584657 RepID=W9GRY4_9MICO|nr:hypothetical protein [Intrasporangium chromatireducens]EWT07568.1 hypothetical protein N864_06415 [Intrasporangium chromatireducens Q5-1]
MLLPELIERHGRVGGALFAVSDDDFAGFTRYGAQMLANQSVGPMDLVLLDAAMTTGDPWDRLEGLSDGSRVLVVLMGEPADVPQGKVVQALSRCELDLVEVTALEEVYKRHVAVVGERGAPRPEPQHARRVTWEWALGRLIAHAEYERRLAQDAEGRQRETQLRRELMDALAMETRLQELTTRLTELEATLEESRRALRELRNAPARRLGDAVLAMRHQPLQGAKGVYDEVMASRRRRKRAGAAQTRKERN